MREGIYWDTSALLKLYVAEPDSPYFLELLAGGEDPLLSSSIATTEVLCALHRKEHAGDLKPGAAATVFRRFMSDVDAGRIVTIPYGGDAMSQVNTVVRLAFRPPRPLPIRSLDAIHIGSGRQSRDSDRNRHAASGSRLPGPAQGVTPVWVFYGQHRDSPRPLPDPFPTRKLLGA